MKPRQIVIDTNVIVAALLSRKGASHKLLLLLGGEKFEVNISVPLFLEYEYVGKEMLAKAGLSEKDFDDILDYISSASQHIKVHYLWRPILQDPKDDMVLELAVAANCEIIVTFNLKDFRGAEKFGINVMTPKEFLKLIGEIK
jgi:putative PIN family toxin of toxin-antitoxin system